VADSQNHRVQKLIRAAPASRRSRSASGRAPSSSTHGGSFLFLAPIAAGISAGRRNGRARGPCHP
jgi:hypothetical protein